MDEFVSAPRYRSNRGGNGLIIGVLIGALITGCGFVAWLMLRDHPQQVAQGSGKVDRGDPQNGPASVQPKPKPQTESPRPTPLPKAAVAPKAEPPKDVEPATFAEAIDVLKEKARKLKADGIAEFEKKEARFSYDERVRVGQLTVRKVTGFNTSASEIRDLQSLGLNMLAEAMATESTLNASDAVSTLKVVWDRSPKSRNMDFLKKKIDLWFFTKDQRLTYLEFFCGNSLRFRDLSPSHRKILTDFAGEEAMENSP